MTETDIGKLVRAFPDDAIKHRALTKDGSKQAPYVQGQTVIRRLNEATGFHWDFVVNQYWTEGSSRLALVTLTLPGMGSRQHIGVQSENAGSGEDALAKGAITDGLKKAATLFGVGLELYGEDFEDEDRPVAQRQAPPAQAQTYQRRGPAPITTDNEPVGERFEEKYSRGMRTVELNAIASAAGIQAQGVGAIRAYIESNYQVKIQGTAPDGGCLPCDVANAVAYYLPKDRVPVEVGSTEDYEPF